MPDLPPTDPHNIPPLLLRQAAAARAVGVSKPAIQKAVAAGRLRPRALLAPSLGARRIVPLFAAADVAAFVAGRRRRRAA